MNNQRKKMVAGNWKMNGNLASLKEIDFLKSTIKGDSCQVVLCPPTTLLTEAVKIARNTSIQIGAQNCNQNLTGAHTGEVSAKMLKEIGVNIVILGHSERRSNHFETNTLVSNKAKTAHQCGLTTIICVGETEYEKVSGQTTKIIREQINGSLPISATEDNTVIAYEPIWAIGTGKTPTIDEISDVHSILRTEMENRVSPSMASKLRILYGGSVNTQNCSEILCVEGVDGALVGGASLLASDFSKIINSA